MSRIRKSLSTKLSLSILLLAVPIFFIALGVLFTQSRHIIRQSAVRRTNSVLSATMQRVCRKLNAIETATGVNSWLITQYLRPDSLQSLAQRIVKTNANVDGCSISAEPDLFPEYGKYFSTYSIREGDSVLSVIEEQYEYFAKPWYRLPKELHKPCWVNFYDEADSLELTLSGMVASYSKPIYNADNTLVGIISTDVSLIRFSKLITGEKPYPRSYFVMIDGEGRYFIHPDSTRLFTQTIFTDIDPRQQSDIIALGHEMTSGKAGQMAVTINGEKCLVCYQPVPNTSWSLAVICPDSDILAGYHKLTYIVVPLLVIGFFLILLLCRKVVAHAIRPINQLLVKTQSIADGNMEVHIPKSKRTDAVGQLQNSFATMLHRLQFHMGSVRYTTEQARRRNDELAMATKLAEEADQQKTTFIQNVSHQIRTPLNIIMGFVQILSDTKENLSEEEMKSVINTMKHNSRSLNRMVMMLFDSSDTGLSQELLLATKHDMVPCNDVARDAINYLFLHYPDVKVNFQSDVADDYCIDTNNLYLMRSLREILYNAAKHSDGRHITLRIEANTAVVRFIIEDKGKGIAEADLDRLFTFFAKDDDLSEGLGLGLPLAKRHAQNLGGDLTLDTSYHDGCRFIMEIPINHA